MSYKWKLQTGRLEKLAYFCYTDYLCTYGAKLFPDEIYAFEHDPVVETVYHQLRNLGPGSKGKVLSVVPEEDELSSDLTPVKIRSKLLFAEDDLKKVESIDGSLRKYERYSTKELVDMTHRIGAPWQRTFDNRSYKCIPDECIRQYHCREVCDL